MIPNSSTETAHASEEVQDIIDRIPQNTISILIGFLLFVVTLMLLAGFTINYPDIVSGKGILSAPHSSVKLVMPSHGKIHLLIKAKQKVEEGTILAYIDDRANYQHIQKIKHALDKIKILDLDYMPNTTPFVGTQWQLGDLGLYYMQFITALEAYQNEFQDSPYDNRIELMQDLIQEQKEDYQYNSAISSTMEEYFDNIEDAVHRDSVLYQSEVISTMGMEQSAGYYLQNKRDLLQTQANDVKQLHSISSSKRKIEELEIEKKQKLLYLKHQLWSAFANLKAQISNWEQYNLLRAPIAGNLEFMQFWKNNQFIQNGTPVFSIIPDGTLMMVETAIPSEGVGKIKVGQEVQVKLQDYPMQEYGYLQGKVSSISLTKLLTEEDNLTLVSIALTNTNTTHYGIPLELKHGMSGTVDIITKDKKLIDRLFDRMKFAVQ